MIAINSVESVMKLIICILYDLAEEIQLLLVILLPSKLVRGNRSLLYESESY